MILNKIAAFTQKKTSFLYQNSILLQNTEKIIFVTIIMTLLSCVFASSDIIGGLAWASILFTLVNLFTKSGEKIELNKYETVLLLFLMLVIISVAGSTLFLLSIKGVLKTLTYLGFYISCKQYFKSHKTDILTVLLILCGCITVESVIAITQNYLKVAEISGWQDIGSLNPEEVMTRVYGTLKPYNPNLLCGYFVSAITALYGMCALFFIEHKKQLTVTAVICSLLATIALFLTGCRGGYIAWLAMVISVVLLGYKYISPRLKSLYTKFVTAVFGVGTLFVLANSALRARVLSIFAFRADSSNSFRFNVYQSCIEMFKDNWLLGIGVGNLNFREIYGLYMKSGFDALSAYNIFLETAVESGVFALIAFVAFLFGVIVCGYKFIKNSDNAKEIILVSISVITIIGLLVHGLTDTVFFRPQIQINFWIMVSIITAYISSSRFSSFE